MDKAEKVTKYPRRPERGEKSHESYMKKLKEKILKDNQPSTSFSANSFTPSTSSFTAG